MGTYTGQNAIDLIKKHIKGMPLDGMEAILVDQVNSLIWTAYPWKWTLADLTPIDLEDGVQDYSLTNNDVFKLITANIVRTDLTPKEYRELSIVESIGVEVAWKGGLESIRRLALMKGNKIRLQMAADISSPVTLQIQGEYQQTPTKITALTTALPIPDHHFAVFTEGLLWRAYKYADDPRAGSIQIVKGGNPVYTGQMGIFFALLQGMMEVEDSTNGEPSMLPGDPNLYGG